MFFYALGAKTGMGKPLRIGKGLCNVIERSHDGHDLLKIPPDLSLTKGRITPLWERGPRGDLAGHDCSTED